MNAMTDQSRIALLNRLLRRSQPMGIEEGRLRAAMTFAPAPAVSPDMPWLNMTVDGEPAALGMSWALVRQMSGQNLEALPPEDAGLLLEEALGTALDLVESNYGVSIQFDSIGDAALDGLIVGFRCRVQAVGQGFPTQHLPLKLSDALAQKLADRLRPVDDAEDPLNPLHLCLRAEVATLVLRLSELRSLQPGDALLLPNDLTRALLLEQQFYATAEQDPSGQITFTGPFRPRRPLGNGETKMNDQAPENPTVPSFDDVEVRLSIQAGDTLVTLQELRAMGPGTMLTLDQPDGNVVDLAVNGQIIGKAELTSVNGQRAVEIRTLFKDG